MEVIERNLKIKANGIDVCYDDQGSGGYPILFIHGFPFNKTSLQPQMNYLKNTHRMIACDIRGFGATLANNEKASITLFADDLIKFMDALEIKKAIVCGLSIGGYILLDAVNRYPERFKAIILSDTQCIADTEEGKEKRYDTIQQIKDGKLTDFASSFVKNIFFKDSFFTKKTTVEKIHNSILATSPQTIIDTLIALAERKDACTVLSKIKMPALIICGKEDAITPIERSAVLFKGIDNSFLKIISDAGHVCNLEQPNEFNKCVINFVAILLKEE